MARRRVGLLDLGPGVDAAWDLVAGLTDADPVRVGLASLDLSRGGGLDVLWVHATGEPPPLPSDRIRAWLEQGGRLLLTQRAAAAVVALGLEPEGPNDLAAGSWPASGDDPTPQVRGFAAYGPHPLFAGLHQGAYVWAPGPGEPYVRATYARGRRPRAGGAVAVERSYIRLDADRIVAWEYPVGAGGVLCLGAFVVPEARHRPLAPHLEAVLGNALVRDGIPHMSRSARVAHWPLPGRTCRPDPTLPLPVPPSLDGALPGLEGPLHFASRALSDETFTLGGRRALAVGGEQNGLRELWLHPHRALQGMEVTLGGETPLVRDAQITPVAVQRHLVSKHRIVEETLTTALEHPIALIEYREEKIGRARNLRAAAELEVRWTVDLRRMWPYPAACGGDLRYRLDDKGRVLVVATEDHAAWCAVVAGGPVAWELEPVRELVALDCRLTAGLDGPLRLAIVGGGSAEDLDAALAALARRGVTGLSRQRVRRAEQRRDQQTRVHTPDAEVNAAFEWAKARLDAFLLDTPGIGRSLAAGYAASRPGWGDGRPGYAWYFGRDACWSALALLATGDFTAARLVLRFLADTQDVTGKVIHEYTTSGLAHYDAADSTPLFLLLAGRYAAWTGDLPFLSDLWEPVERAYRYCLGTDRDGDGLIENTGVGHGWIEMGPLAGAHVTFYLAGIWIAALEAMAPVARALGRPGLAAECLERGARARAASQAAFQMADGYALGILPDRAPLRHRTALTAVPLLLRAADPGVAAPWLEAVASAEFSTPWGVRLISAHHPLYNPVGYHTGSVWPLYTGWVSLAEYACHRGDAAFEHLRANARLPFRRALGAFDEVLRGEEERAAGICPDQAWSAAMLVSPLIEGMLGVTPDAVEGRLALSPHLPREWPWCEWRGLRIGATALDVRVRSRPEAVSLQIRRVMGPPVSATLRPAVSSAGGVSAVVDGESLRPRVSEDLRCPHAEVTLEVRGEHDVDFVTAAPPP